MSKTIYHNHHIIPRHMGGTDDPSNIVRLTIEEHALAHKELYRKYQKYEDFLAWKMLEGQMNNQEYLLERAKLGGMRSSSKGVSKSEDWKKKMSHIMKGKKRPNISGNKHPRKSSVYAGNIYFESVMDAAKYYNTSKNTVRNRCLSDNFQDWYYIKKRI